MLEKISVTNGVFSTNEEFDCYKIRRYKPNTFKPKGNWKEIDDVQFNSLIMDSSNFVKNQQIEVFKLPQNIIEVMDQIGFSKCKNEDDFVNIFEQNTKRLEDLMVLMADLFSDIVNINYSIKDVKLLCFSYEKPKIETMAYSLSDEKYLGLHIDNGQGKNLFNRGDNPNRLSINLGSEPRYLLFVNECIDGLINLIKIKKPNYSVDQDSEIELVSSFFSLYPNFPVYRIRLLPYEAYIAPTDFIIHDGSTLGKNNPDITLVFLGQFEPFN